MHRSSEDAIFGTDRAAGRFALEIACKSLCYNPGAAAVWPERAPKGDGAEASERKYEAAMVAGSPATAATLMKDTHRRRRKAIE